VRLEDARAAEWGEGFFLLTAVRVFRIEDGSSYCVVGRKERRDDRGKKGGRGSGKFCYFISLVFF